LERRGFCRRLALRITDVADLREYYSSARFLGLPFGMALRLAFWALDYPAKTIAFAWGCRGCCVRESLRVGRERIGARDRGDCVRIFVAVRAARSSEAGEP